MWPAFYAVCLLAILAGIPGSDARLQPARTSRSIGAVFVDTLQTILPHAVAAPFWFYPRARFVCPRSGFFPDRNNCKLFYKCVTVLSGDFVRHIYKCEDHHLYSIEMEACVSSEQVNRIECQKKIVTNPPPPLPPPPQPPKSQVVVTDLPQPPPKPHIQSDVQHLPESTSVPRENQSNRTNLLGNVSPDGTRTVPQNLAEITPLLRGNHSGRTNPSVTVQKNGTRMISELGMDLPSFYKMHKEIDGRFDLYSTKFEQSTSSGRKEPADLPTGILTKLTPASGTSSVTQSTEHVLEKNTQNIASKTLTTGKLSFEHKEHEKHPYLSTPDLLLSDDILFEDSTEDSSPISSATAPQISTSTKTLFDQDSDDDDDDDDTRESVPTEESTDASEYPSPLELFEQDTEDNVTEEPSERNGVEGCVESGFFPDPYNCSKFYRCVDFGSEFVKYSFSCPNGTIWDDSLKSCNFPRQVKRTNACVYFAPPTPTELPFTVIEPDDPIVSFNVSRLIIACPTGFRAHRKYCNMFYQCTVDKRLKINFMTFACPEGTVFHEKEVQCAKDEKVSTDPEGCAIFEQEEIPDSIQILDVPDGKLCPNIGQFPDGRICSNKYFRCTRDNEGALQGFLLDCPRWHVYSHAANRCVSLFLHPFCMRRYLSTKH